MSSIAKSISYNSEIFFEYLDNRVSNKQRQVEVRMTCQQNEAKKLAAEEMKEENKILLKDVISIRDPVLRVFFVDEQTRILRKRAG
ncbi:hypothetical protein Sjap_013840 [Stephania japonica]|uniref:Uncharacterized protein n=1 Tax=Stephania japonica TaxID=461633 RepID=A0AAP0NZ00_9MAGN